MKNVELEKIADILPPSAPVNSSELILETIFLLVLFVVTMTSIHYYHSKKQQLKRLRKKHQKKIINQRQLAFELNHLLTQKTPQPGDHSWEIFHRQLQTACFSRNGLENDVMEDLINRAAQWI